MADHDSTLDPANVLSQPPEVKRRDFMSVATGALVRSAQHPRHGRFIDQMEPSAGVLAAGGPISVDLSSVAAGQQVVVRWPKSANFLWNGTGYLRKHYSNVDLFHEPTVSHN